MSTETRVQLWEATLPRRYFLVPQDVELLDGPLALRTRLGEERRVDPVAVESFEVSEDQAHRWTRTELGTTLTDLRASLDVTLSEIRARLDEERHKPVAPDTTVTPNAVPALLEFLRALPGIVGGSISGDEERIAGARASLAQIQNQLGDGGIELDERFTGFADRLAGLRREFEERKASAQRPDTDYQDDDDPSRGTSENAEPGSSR